MGIDHELERRLDKLCEILTALFTEGRWYVRDGKLYLHLSCGDIEHSYESALQIAKDKIDFVKQYEERIEELEQIPKRGMTTIYELRRVEGMIQHFMGREDIPGYEVQSYLCEWHKRLKKLMGT